MWMPRVRGDDTLKEGVPYRNMYGMLFQESSLRLGHDHSTSAAHTSNDDLSIWEKNFRKRLNAPKQPTNQPNIGDFLPIISHDGVLKTKQLLCS